MTPSQLSGAVLAALDDIVENSGLELAGELPRDVLLTRPRDPRRGDYATGFALEAASRVGVPASDLAGALAARLGSVEGITAAVPAGPGFLNITLAPEQRTSVAAEIVAAGAAYGRDDRLAAMVTPPVEGVHPGIDTGALRYVAARTPAGGRSSLDLATLERADVANPAYLVQYAHARAASLLRGAAALGLRPAGACSTELLDGPREAALLGALAAYPGVVATAVRLHQPHRVPRHLEQVAAALLNLAEDGEVLPRGDREPTGLHRSRLLLVAATMTVLRNGLDLLGVAAPERM